MTPPATTQRKRVSQACDRCRSRKDKCDGIRPVCSTCALGGHACSYDPSIKKRGLPEGYVRGLEKLWGFTIREAPDVEATILSLIDRKDGIDALSRAWSDKDCEETLLDTWRKSRLSRELDTLLPLLEIADDKSAKRKRQDSSFTLPIATSVPDAGPLSRGALLANADEHRTSTKIPVQTPSGSIPPHAPRPAAVEPVELPYNVWELLDVYFSYTHCWLPIVEKHNLLRASYLYPTCVSPSMPGSGDHAALWAILAYAECHHAGISRSLAHTPNPQPKSPWVASDLYKRARSLIPDEDGTFELGHVQGLLLLTLLNMGQNRWKQAWALIGLAVRNAVDLALGDNVDDGKSRNRHVYFGCFILDTLVAARLKRYPYLRTQHVLQRGPLQEDGLDEWNPWVDCLGTRRTTGSGSASRGPGAALSTYNRLVQISAILNTIICEHSVGTENLRKCEALLQKFSLGTTAQEKSGMPLLPQQYYVTSLYTATCTLLKAEQLEQRNPTEESLIALLDNLQGYYGLAAIPPVLDCVINVFIRQYSSRSDAVTSDGVLDKLAEMVFVMAQTWPTFGDTLLELRKLRSSFSNALEAEYGQFRSPNSNIVTGMNNGFEDSQPQRHSMLEETLGTPSSSSTYATSGHAILEAAIRFDPSILAMTNDIQQTATSPWAFDSAPLDLAVSPPTARQSNMESATKPYYPAFGAQNDDDSMFNEFATLDAMKW